MVTKSADIMVGQPVGSFPIDLARYISGKKSVEVLGLNGDTKVFFLPDGNGRAGEAGFQQGYIGGGEKVRETGNALAEDGCVSEVTFAILTKENINLRHDDFFKQLYLAFTALAAKMINDKGTFAPNIFLEVVGDLSYLKTKDKVKYPYAHLLVDKVKSVVALNNRQKPLEPQMKVKFAFAYSPEYLEHENVNVVVRTGMHAPDTARLSGLVFPKGVVCLGYEDLWPNFNVEKVVGALRELGKRPKREVCLGYDEELVEEMVFLSSQRLRKLVLPAVRPIEDLRRSLSKRFPSNVRSHGRIVGIQGYDRELEIDVQSDSDMRRRIIVADPDRFLHRYFVNAGAYDGLVLPGQKNDFVLPVPVDMKYATMVGCPIDGIGKAVQEAVNFAVVGTQTLGGPREKPLEVESILSVPERVDGYIKLLPADGKAVFPNEIKAGDVLSVNGKRTVFEYYASLSKLFVADHLKRAEAEQSPVEIEPQFFAFVNIVLTVYFMCYYGHFHEMDDNWKKRAEGLLEYMKVIFSGDERLFDVMKANHSIEDHRKRVKSLNAGFQKYLQSGLNLQGLEYEKWSLDTADSSKVTEILSRFKKLLDESGCTDSSWYKQEWLTDLKGFYDSCEEEWEPPKEFEARAILLVNDEKFCDEIKNSVAPCAFKEGFLKARDNLLKDVKDGKNLAMFKLYLHLWEVRRSIGAGLSLRTLGLYMKDETATPENRKLLDEVVMLNDMFYRVLNDLSALARESNDKELTRDCLMVLRPYYLLDGMNECEVENHTFAYLKKLSDDLERELKIKNAILRERIPEIGIPSIRAEIAAKIYRLGHYRTIDPKRVLAIIEEMFMTGSK